MQVWPDAAKIPARTPASAASSWASSKTMFADFPPSSKVAGVRCSAAPRAMARAVAGPPVKAMWSTPGCAVSAAPAPAPEPVTTFITPGGRPACSKSCASSSSDADVNSLGLITMVFPAASAGAIFHIASISGEFHGAMAATTPTGSRTV